MKFKKRKYGDTSLKIKAAHGDKMEIIAPVPAFYDEGANFLFIITEKDGVETAAFITPEQAEKLALAILKELK